MDVMDACSGDGTDVWHGVSSQAKLAGIPGVGTVQSVYHVDNEGVEFVQGIRWALFSHGVFSH